jgi:formate dehydrogenase subunit beta
MVHMSTLCVGCGQCSSACPNGIDVMEMFRSTAAATQARFGYVPGRAYEDKQPMATFQEDELGDATGQDA